MLQERGGEGRGGALHRARDERTNERNEGREEGRGGKRRRRASFRTVLEKVVAYTPHLLTYITLVSPPPSTPTIGRHKLSRYNAAHGTDGRTDGWTAGRPLLPRHRCDPLSDTPPPSHLPQPRPCVSFALDKIMSRWRAHLGRNSPSRPGRGSLDNPFSRAYYKYI